MAATLEALRTTHRDRILLRVISGSRAYGLHTPTSDTDERGLFALPALDYVTLREPQEHLQDERGDTVYLGLRKFLSLASAANPGALELLYAPQDTVLFRSPALEPLLAQRHLFVTRRCLDSYVGYARAQIGRARGQNKWINHPQPEELPPRERFCHVLLGPWPGSPAGPQRPLRPRPLAEVDVDLRHCHCAALERVPRTYRLYHYGAAAKGVFRNGQLVCESIPEEDEASRLIGLLVYDEEGWERAVRDHGQYWQWRHQRNEARWRTQEAGEIDYDAKNMMHTLRLLAEAESVLREGRPRVRCTEAEREFLLQVRAGRFPYDDLVARAEAKVAELGGLAANCALPAEVDPAAVDALLREVTTRWEAGRA